MLNKQQIEKLQNFISQFSKEELLWLSGYLIGKAEEEDGGAAPVGTAVVSKITIAYGTETGNSKKIANQLAARAKQMKVNPKVVSMEQYKLTDLEKEEYFFTIVSTHGDGEPPAAAKKFYEHIHSSNSNLPKLKYSVLALGDTAYPLFCKTGADVDARFQKLGGTRLVDRKDCDVDFEPEANLWIDEVLRKLSTSPSSNGTAAKVTDKKKPSGRVIYKGKITANVNLNDRGSKKETYHIEITPESEAHYAPGDSIGIVPTNYEADVQAVLKQLNTIGSDFVTHKGERYSFYQLLRTKLSILQLPARILTKYAALEKIPIEIKGSYDLADLLYSFPVKIAKGNWQLLVDILEPIAPRLYSVASSNAAHNEEVHLTVARSAFYKNGEKRYGLASNYLSQLPKGTDINFYVQKNNAFHLPADDKDIIMVGPGTGIAPFRAFVAERDARGAEGRNWLFFGDQHFKTDFLYQTEWQNYLETGVLTRLEVAFSRDTDQKVYVQHKLKKQSKEIFEWLQSGAYFYVCGAKEPMSVDVENTLLEIIAEHGSFNKQEAEDYLNDLKEEGRYLKDVY
ncbi:MAG: flavodoxin domain-containing protein [Bacteroidota bacterium]